MVGLDVVTAANDALVREQLGLSPRRAFVAVVAGGTAGIGAGAVRQLAAAFGRADEAAAVSGKEEGASEPPRVRVYIVGRNQGAADDIIAECLKACPAPRGDFRFVRAENLAILRDVDRVCAEIAAAEREATEREPPGSAAKVDFLVTSQGVLSMVFREETAEGLDITTSLYYYSRMRFAYNLLPLLAASSLPQGARFVSVLNPRLDGKMSTEDLSASDPKLGLRLRGTHVSSMATFFMEAAAARERGRLALCNVYPGIVETKAIDAAKAPAAVKWLVRYILSPALRPWSISTDECGSRLLFLASPGYPARDCSPPKSEQEAAGGPRLEVATGSDGQVGSGSYRVGSDGEIVQFNKQLAEYRAAGMADKVWQHTLDVFQQIETKGKFKP